MTKGSFFFGAKRFGSYAPKLILSKKIQKLIPQIQLHNLIKCIGNSNSENELNNLFYEA
jgi:hypothetical protein